MSGHNKMAIKDNRILNPAKREKVRKVFQVHAEKCSVSGVSFITGTKYTVVRVCWTALLTLALIAMSIHLGLLFIQYFNYQKQSLTDLDFNVLPFPAITLCNVNPVRMSKVHLASPMLKGLITSFDTSKLKFMNQEFVKNNELVHRDMLPPRQVFAATPNIVLRPPPILYSSNNDSMSPTSDPYPQTLDDNDDGMNTNVPETPSLSPPAYDSPQEKQYYSDTENDNTDDNFDEDLSNIVAGDFDFDSFLESSWDDHTAEEPDNIDLDRVQDGVGDSGGMGSPPAAIRFPDNSTRNTEDGNDTTKETSEDETISIFSKLHTVFRILYSNEPPEKKAEMGHSLQDMLIHCDFAGGKCKASDFKLIPSNVYGNCYNLQYERSVANDGPLSGVNIILHLELGQYMKGFTPSKGIQVVVHDRNTIPFPEDEGFSAAAGSHTMVGLKMVRKVITMNVFYP